MPEEQNFFTDGAAYERLMGRWSVPVGEVFLEWLAQPEGLRWLDVGCGNGAFTELIVARCAPADVQGLDPSEAQIAFARKRLGTRLAQFRQGDAQALPFANDAFDTAAMALVINFIPDPAKAIAEMTRVVRPGGWVGTYMWDVTGGGSPTDPTAAAMRSMGIVYATAPSTTASRQDSMRALWEQAGLTAIDTRVIRIRIAYSNFDDFWESQSVRVGPTGQAIHGMAPSAKEQLRDLLRERLPADPQGRVSYSAHANAVKGQVRR
jgi:ubiquinone/menaquinone biosynthesis C-methylase UbiE